MTGLNCVTIFKTAFNLSLIKYDVFTLSVVLQNYPYTDMNGHLKHLQQQQSLRTWCKKAVIYCHKQFRVSLICKFKIICSHEIVRMTFLTSMMRKFKSVHLKTATNSKEQEKLLNP